MPSPPRKRWGTFSSYEALSNMPYQLQSIGNSICEKIYRGLKLSPQKWPGSGGMCPTASAAGWNNAFEKYFFKWSKQ